MYACLRDRLRWNSTTAILGTFWGQLEIPAEDFSLISYSTDRSTSKSSQRPLGSKCKVRSLSSSQRSSSENELTSPGLSTHTMGPSKAVVKSSTDQGPDLRKPRSQSSGTTTMLRQRLLWPPPPSSKTSKNSDDSDRGTVVEDAPSGTQVDLIQATRMTSNPVPLPVGCGLDYVDSGVRFDPGVFPDLSRKTQEKLAGRIIEAGTSREYGRTIKVKEYSSKTRKRIRFACSRDDCNVTFQINFDSNKGFWYMKRNKGNFDHSCSALKSASKTLFCTETDTRPHTPPIVPVSPPLSKPRTIGSSKTSSGPPPIPSSLTSPSRAPPLRRRSTSSLKRSNEDSDSSASPHRSTPKKIRTTRSADTASTQVAKKSPAKLVTPQTKPAPRGSKSSSGASKSKRNLSMAREPRPSSAASAESKKESNNSGRASKNSRTKPISATQSTQSSVTVSVSSQEAAHKAHPLTQHQQNEMFTTTVSQPYSLGVFDTPVCNIDSI